MSPVNRRYNRTRRQRYYRRRAVRGPLRQLIRKQRRWNNKKRTFRISKQLDTKYGFQYAKYQSDDYAFSIPLGTATNPSYQNVTVNLATVAAISQIIGAFSRIYEWYRIRKVVVTLIPQFTDISGTTQTYYEIGSIINKDHDTEPVSGSLDFRNWPNGNGFKITRGSKWHTRVIKMVPADTVPVAIGSTTLVQQKLKFAPWISTKNKDVIHYGMMFYIRVANGVFPVVTDVPFRLRLKTYYAFKGFSRYAI